MGSESDRRRDTDNGLLEGVEGGPIGHALGLFRPVPPPDGVLAVRAPRYLARFPSSAFHRTACAAGCLSCVWLAVASCRRLPFEGRALLGIETWRLGGRCSVAVSAHLADSANETALGLFFFSLPLLFV